VGRFVAFDVDVEHGLNGLAVVVKGAQGHCTPIGLAIGAPAGSDALEGDAAGAGDGVGEPDVAEDEGSGHGESNTKCHSSIILLSSNITVFSPNKSRNCPLFSVWIGIIFLGFTNSAILASDSLSACPLV